MHIHVLSKDIFWSLTYVARSTLFVFCCFLSMLLSKCTVCRYQFPPALTFSTPSNQYTVWSHRITLHVVWYIHTNTKTHTYYIYNLLHTLHGHHPHTHLAVHEYHTQWYISQAVDIHKEKVARREIGALASSKNITRAQKIVLPTQKERPQKFMRQRLDFTCLDSIGHGTKVTESTTRIDERYGGKEVNRPGLKPFFYTGNSSQQLPILTNTKISIVHTAV